MALDTPAAPSTVSPVTSPAAPLGELSDGLPDALPAAMPAVPLPFVTAAILLYLVLRSRLRGERAGLIDTVLLLCAAQAVLVTLNLHVGLSWAARLQPFTAVLIPPAAYLTWIALVQRPPQPADAARHAAGPLAVAAALLFLPQAIDFLVPGLYALYGALLVWRLSGGPDSVVTARLDGAALSLRLWRAIALALLGSAASDVLISAAIALGRPELGVWIVTVFTSLALLGLGALSLLREESVGAASGASEGEPADPAATLDAEAGEAEDRALVERARALLVTQSLYRDPDLTLGRLARRLTVPAKRLSAAVNRVEGRNVSQFVNRFRVEAVCRRLDEDGARVTESMLEAGFRTKSNFNREFRRVTGTSPTEWARSRGGDAVSDAPERR